MKDIKAIMAEHGEGLDEDAVAAIVKAVGENYRSINEVNAKAARITELEEQNASLSEQVGKLEGNSEELDTLRAQVEDFKTREENRKAEEAEREKRDSFRTLFDAAIGEKEFANEIVRDSVFEKVYAKCSETTGLNPADAIADVVGDSVGVWVNPQTDPKAMPQPGDVQTKNTPTTEEADRKTLIDFMFPKQKE